MSATRWRGTRFLHSSRKRYSTRWPSHEAESETVGVRTSREVKTTMDHCSCAHGRMRCDALARRDDGIWSTMSSLAVSQEITAERALSTPPFTPILDCSPYDFRAPKSSDATRKLSSRHPAREKASRARRRHRGRARRAKVSRSRLVLPSHRFRGLCVSPRARKVIELLRVTASYIELKSSYTVQIGIGASS